MPPENDNINEDPTPEVEDATTVETVVENPDETPEDVEEPVDADEPHLEQDPVKLRQMLTSARKEAAKYRVNLRGLKEKLSSEYTSKEDFDVMKSSLSEQISRLEKESIVREFKLPDILADSIKGDTDEEMRESAKNLADAIKPAKFTPLETESPGGGLDPTRKPRIDAIKAAQDYYKQSKRF